MPTTLPERKEEPVEPEVIPGILKSPTKWFISIPTRFFMLLFAICVPFGILIIGAGSLIFANIPKYPKEDKSVTDDIR